MRRLGEIVSRVRQPAYTGANRCLPCTALNVGITAAASLGVAVVAGGRSGLPAAAAVAAIGLTLIYLRGYLVPGTPTLTKRYLPDAVVARFGKGVSEPTPVTGIDIEDRLVAASILEPCPAADDLCLNPAFRRAWRRRIDGLGSQTAFDAKLSLFMNDAEWAEIDHETLETTRTATAYKAAVEGRQIAYWESKAAFVADCAAVELLADRLDHWEGFGFAVRTELAGSLRLWLDRCPACGEGVTPGHTTVESCCRSVDVISMACAGCDSRLFEIEYDPGATPAAAD